MRRWSRSRVLSGLVVLAGFLLAPAAARAGVAGSPHDFSDTTTSPAHPTRSAAIAPAGACSGCHLPHGAAPGYVLWPRDLDRYGTYLVSNGIVAVPNYVLPPTIQCYDCHDLHGGGGIDDNPALTNFDGSHQPQNTAFGFTKVGTGSMTPDAPGGSVSGFYENKPPFGSNYGADPALVPTASPYPADNTNLLKTGGHYFKRKDPTGTGGDAFDIGDKLPCRDCHDPHAWNANWQAFMRWNWPTSAISSYLGSSAAASPNMANAPITGSRDTFGGGRKLCIACHGTSDTRAPVNFRDISVRYAVSAGAIARPTPNLPAHSGSDTTTPCVSCHAHNSIDASCGDCHGNPPPSYPAGRNPGSYVVMPERTHSRHVGHLSDNATRYSSYSYACAVCHANSALHQDNNVNVVYDFSFLGKGNPPSFQPFTGPIYNRTTCANVYCHSLGLSAVTGVTVPPATPVAYFRSVQWGTPPLGCNGCHGTTTAAGTVQFGMPDHQSGAAGSPSANSHAAHVVNNGYECSVCHFNTVAGTYLARTIRGAETTPPTANAYHVDGNAGGPGDDVAFDGTTATGSYTQDNTDLTRNKRCAVSCHNSQSLPVLQQPQWGNPGSATCTACHLTSAADSDQYLNGTTTWFQNNVTANLDNTEWTWSGHGKSSGSYDVSGRPAADLLGGGTGDNPCLYCHDPGVGHKVGTNPFRLKFQEGVTGFSGLGWNATCLVCHRKALPRPGYDPDNTATVYANQVADNAFVDNNHYGAEHGAGNNGGGFCWDCHDAHGDRKEGGPGNIYMVHKGTLARQTEGTYGYPGSALNLTNNAPVFTNVTTGTSYADNIAFRGICQVCHTRATTGHYRYNFGDGHNEGSRCTNCHVHDAGFAATRCEGCHGGENGELAPVQNAPKVTTYWKTSGHGQAAVACETCHDVSNPAGAHKTDGTGAVNTLNWQGKGSDTTNTNTPHLKAFFFPSPPATASQYAQAMDQACGERAGCHEPTGAGNRPVKRMEHSKDGLMEFGTKGTRADPKGAGTWFTEGPGVDFRTRAPWVVRDIRNDVTAAPVYGLCVSCHDPHGTGTPVTDNVGQNDTRNVMVRGNWRSDPAGFCSKVCH